MSDDDNAERLKHGVIYLMSHDQIQKCPFLIMTPEHYREDGTCRCNEREHSIMVEWGYSWDEKAERWIGEDDEPPYSTTLGSPE